MKTKTIDVAACPKPVQPEPGDLDLPQAGGRRCPPYRKRQFISDPLVPGGYVDVTGHAAGRNGPDLTTHNLWSEGG